MHLYETAIVFDSQAKSEEIEERINNVKNFITNHGGTIVSSEEVGKRRLAYEINKKQYGYYIYIRFNAQGNLIALLEREYRLSENVLRYLTLKIDKNQILAEEKSAGEQSDKGEKTSETVPAEAPKSVAKVEETEEVATKPEAANVEASDEPVAVEDESSDTADDESEKTAEEK